MNFIPTHSDECILIASHANNKRKQLNLRKLINNLKPLNIDICLVSHISLPEDLTNDCDYYLYDKYNPLINSPEIKYWTHTSIPGIKFSFKGIDDISTHVLAFYRQIFGGLNYLYSLGYRKIHYFDYDTEISNLEEISNNSKLLDQYSVIAYEDNGGKDIQSKTHKITAYIGLNLSLLEMNVIKYNEQQILNNYSHYFNSFNFPICENMLFDIYFKTKNIKIKSKKETKLNIIPNTETSTHSDVFTTVNVYNDYIHFFHDNKISKINNFDIILESKNKVKKVYSLNILPKKWFWMNTKLKIEEVNYIKIYKNGSLFTFIDLNTKKGKEMITKWSKVTPF